MQHTIIVSTYLGGPTRSKKLSYIERLDAYLRHFNFHLLLVHPGGSTLSTHCECVRLADYALKNTKARQASDTVREISLELALAATIEAEFQQTDFWLEVDAIEQYIECMRELFLQHKPCLCILWHQFTGRHRTLTALCRELDIPYIFAHLGVLPGTIVFEQGGEMAESWIAQQNDKFLRLPANERDLAMADRYLMHVRQQKKTRKPQPTDRSIKDIVQKNRQRNRKIIFYAGQHDYRSGMWPCWLPEARIHTPFFVHTLDALQYLARLAEANDWHILFKPHPNIQTRQTNFQGFCRDRIDFVTGANVFECISESDLTVTILSQTSYLSLIHRRPTLLLGRNQLSGKGCTYEITSQHDVEDTIQQALQAGFTTDQQKQWLKHIAQVCKYYIFAFDTDIADIIGRNLDEAARYLMLQSRFSPTLYSFHKNNDHQATFPSESATECHEVSNHDTSEGFEGKTVQKLLKLPLRYLKMLKRLLK